MFGPNGELLPQLLTTNIGAALAQGAELEMIIVPTEKWRFNVNLGYLDAKYTDIAPVTLGTNLNTEFQQAPKHTGSAGIQYVVSDSPMVDAKAKHRGGIAVETPLNKLRGFDLITIWLNDPDGVTNYYAQIARKPATAAAAPAKN